MKHLLSICLSFGLFCCIAQSQVQYKQLDFGTYSIGFSDTVIFQKNINYNYKSYSGAIPIPLKIWHPLKETPSSEVLTAQAFQNTKNLPPELLEVEADLLAKFEDYYRFNILEQDYIHFDEISYPILGSQLLLNYIKKAPTKSYSAKPNGNQNFPILIYHHGSRGTAFDNYVMAEYFASHGYIVIAGNFNLPYENQPYGFTKNDPYDSGLSESIIGFAQGLDSTSKIGFIGHSWGAQIGFSILPDEKRISAFVSMETTLELWNRKQVKGKWPRLSSKIRNNYTNFNLPILMFANHGEATKVSFDFFTPIQSPQMIFATHKKEFVHESYASYYSSRLIFQQSFPQHDAKEFEKQIQYFAQNMALMKTFLDENLMELGSDYLAFEKDFYLRIINEKNKTKEPKPNLINSPN